MQQTCYTTGLMRLFDWKQSRYGAVVLMYHSVADTGKAAWLDPHNHISPELFEQQMCFLAKHRKVVSLSDLYASLCKGKRIDEKTVVITFDDGYLDNLEIAAPIIKKYELSATLFLPTRYIDNALPQWIDRLYSSFKFRNCNILTLDDGSIFDLSDANAFNNAYQKITSVLFSLSLSNRENLLSEIEKKLQSKTDIPRLTMNWDDVRLLISEYDCFELGSHTLEHTDMTTVSEEEGRQELQGSFSRIFEETKREPVALSFPYGRSGEALTEIAEQVGYKMAFGACGHNVSLSNSSDLFDIQRVEAPANMKRFSMETDSLNNLFWRRIGRCD